ncbi:MAG: hypothetical protein H7240_11750 [Glaciimonas sp.]|nr:hypothetical protein [Glaciimonas sp.]
MSWGEIEAQLLACSRVREAAVWCMARVTMRNWWGMWWPKRAQVGSIDRYKNSLRNTCLHGAGAMYVARTAAGDGKLDRRALPVPTWEGRLYRVPQIQDEISLAAIWAQVLKRDRVGLADHFFELMGGHSLVATRMCTRI